jgi:HD-like signal output (HDOD) protein
VTLPRILFVDDEPRILAGLRRMLYRQRDRWDMAFADGSAQALTILQDRPCDVIISDFRMPGMDGAALLRRVRDEYPDTARVILSGQTNENSLLEILVLAHRFLNKPATEQQIIDTVERLLDVRADLVNERVRRDAGVVDSLPSPPSVLHELQRALDDDDGSMQSIADVIAQDPAAAAQVLHLVNSSAYALAKPVSDITQAATLLGIDLMRSLVLMHDVMRGFPAVAAMPPEWIQRLTTHAVETSRLARELSAGTPWARDAFTAGLLHEIGQLVLASSRPTGFAEALERWRSEDTSLIAVERELLGVTHVEAGAHLLGLWGLPAAVVDAAAGHAEGPAGNPHDLSSTVALAHAVVEQAFGPTCIGPERVEESGLDERTTAAIQRWRRRWDRSRRP